MDDSINPKNNTTISLIGYNTNREDKWKEFRKYYDQSRIFKITRITKITKNWSQKVT